MAKVLLVEDDINLREIYAARLSAEGYELVTASDGEEALSKAVSEKPNLIVLDVMMPKISGFDVLDILRSTPETETTKVIMLSALSQETDQQRGEKLGADKYLIKSQITLEDVVETVKSMVDGGSGESSDTPAIVTTSSGRLPEEESGGNEQAQAGANEGQNQPNNAQPEPTQQQPAPQQNEQPQTTQSQPQEQPPKQDVNEQPAQQPAPVENATEQPPQSTNSTADEIAHIDNQMQSQQQDQADTDESQNAK